jgi:hypothetical protein
MKRLQDGKPVKDLPADVKRVLVKARVELRTPRRAQAEDALDAAIAKARKAEKW